MPLRSVGLRVTNLKDENFAEQITLFEDNEEQKKEELIENSLNTVRKKFGNKSIKRATVIKKEIDFEK